MPNHLLSDTLKSWKQFTSRRAKKILHLREEPFWQPESYDHWIRSEEEKARIARYIRNNPVTAAVRASGRLEVEQRVWGKIVAPLRSADFSATGRIRCGEQVCCIAGF
jgi:hypothetical protein